MGSQSTSGLEVGGAYCAQAQWRMPVGAGDEGIENSRAVKGSRRIIACRRPWPLEGVGDQPLPRVVPAVDPLAGSGR